MAEPVNVVLSLHLNPIGLVGICVVMAALCVFVAFLSHLDKDNPSKNSHKKR